MMLQIFQYFIIFVYEKKLNNFIFVCINITVYIDLTSRNTTVASFKRAVHSNVFASVLFLNTYTEPINRNGQKMFLVNI